MADRPLTPRRPDSILRRLQATGLLAVLAGYAVLLVANHQLAARSRRQAHRQAVELVVRALAVPPAAADPAALQGRVARLLTPGLKLRLQPGPGPGEAANEAAPELMWIRGRVLLASTVRLGGGVEPLELRVVQDLTAEVERERTTQLLLIVAAGFSCLFTGGLLRLALRRGLRPLERLSGRVAAITSESLATERLALEGQPQELRPIVASFNGLLDRLAASWERQRLFVDGVAHELRTPITLIRGYGESLQRQAAAAGGLQAADLAPLRQIEAEGERMGRLVADLLDIAREDAGRLELRAECFDLDEALLLAFERLQPLAPGRLRLEAPQEGEPALAHGDPERLQQCLTNLVENALRYSPAGSPVELFSSRTAAGLIAHVRDHGTGVPPGERERIFGRFERGSAAGPGGGSGLGLAVVRLLMKRMGGSVRVNDAPGGGADFQLLLPVARSAE